MNKNDETTPLDNESSSRNYLATENPISFEALTSFADAPATTSSERKMCVTCRDTVRLTSFGRQQLIQGDHIEMKGKGCMGIFYNHHAVFDEFVSNEKDNTSEQASNENETFVQKKIKVYEVSGKNWFGCGEKIMKIKQEEYDVYCREIKRNDYKYRNNDHTATFEKAKKLKDKSIKQYYCCCFRNCEHFATECVNGKEIGPDINTGTCKQATFACSQFFQLILASILAIFYFFNFYIYAGYGIGDKSFQFRHISLRTVNWFEDKCVHKNGTTRAFVTHCDWYTLAIVEGSYFAVFIGLLCCQCKLYSKKYKCKLCLLTFAIVWIFKILLILVFEVLNIFFEKYLYKILKSLNGPMYLTVIIIVVLFYVEAIFVYVLSHTFAKLLLYTLGNRCCIDCCRDNRKKCCSCYKSYCCKCLCNDCKDVDQFTYLYV